MVQSLLIELFIPPKLWVEILSTAIYFINRLSSSTLNNQTLYFLLHQNLPSYNHLGVYFIFLPPQGRTKLFPQSLKCAFLGYVQNQKGFMYFDPTIQHIHFSRNIIFLDHQNFFPSFTVTSNESYHSLFLAFEETSISSPPNTYAPITRF